MEKSVIIILICCFSITLKAQDSLCVFNIKGSAYNKISNGIKVVTKGSFITSKTTLIVSEFTKIVAINSIGDAYKIEADGNYNFDEIIMCKMNASKNLTTKYFKLIWSEFTKKKSNKTIIGGVFRGNFLMEYPKDSVKWASSKITLQWKTEREISEYFVFVRNLKTNKILKLSTNGSQLSLYNNLNIFSEGTQYEWVVTTQEFPNLKNTPFFNFTLIDRNAYVDLTLNYTDLIKDLEGLGFTKTEIETLICDTYGLCK
jgi:hypothetical protein